MIPKIYIVDDEFPARARLKTLLDDLAVTCPTLFVGEASDPATALNDIARVEADIVLLDVQMPGMSGLELAQHLSALKSIRPPAIIFITAFDEYAVRAFDVHATDYLLKPVRASRLAEAITRASTIRSQATAIVLPQPPKGRQFFTVAERNRLLLVPIADVLYLKADQKYVTLRTQQREYLLEESLSSIEDEMATTFVRVHRNALVARDAIVGVERLKNEPGAEGDAEKTIDSWQVLLRGCEDLLPISRRQWAVIKALVR